jgi:predicted nuclease with TOPRIM domain
MSHVIVNAGYADIMDTLQEHISRAKALRNELANLDEREIVAGGEKIHYFNFKEQKHQNRLYRSLITTTLRYQFCTLFSKVDDMLSLQFAETLEKRLEELGMDEDDLRQGFSDMTFEQMMCYI